MTISRIIPNICSDRLAETRDFYVNLLAFEVTFDSDWFVQVTAPGNPSLGIGIIRRDHELVPVPFQQAPQGAFVTVVVEDADDVFERAQQLGADVVQPPRDEFYGQRRFLVTDPSGFLVDVSSPTAPPPS